MSNTDDYQKIGESIFQYIINTLSNCIDDDIFSCVTLEDLGKLYYQKILSSIAHSTKEHIDAVVHTFSRRDSIFNNEGDYYKNICGMVWIKSLPKASYSEVRQKYDSIFVIKYSSVLTLIDTEKNKIDVQITAIDNSESTIRQAIRSARCLIYDLETEENKLYNLGIQRKFLEVQKEMFCWLSDYTTNQLKDFCDFDDSNAVNEKLKAEALKLSKDGTITLDLLFSPYEDIINITEDVVQRPHTVHYKVKFYPIWANAYRRYRQSSFLTDEVDDAIEQYKSDLAAVPSFDVLHNLKLSQSSEYLDMLKNCIQVYDVLNMLGNNIDAGICLRNRKNILKKSIQLYKEGEYELFDNIAPIQIEGLFADFLNDSTIFSRFTNPQIYSSAVLREKITILQRCSDNLYPEAVQYFKFYFNSIVRNKIAHGSYQNIYDNSEQAEIFACETILDLNFMVYMISRQSETEKMYRFIHGYKSYYSKLIKEENSHFGALFNDLAGDKVIHEYDRLEKYRPIQVAYWLVNPYYERIYESIADKSELLELREDFLSQDFWIYVVKTLKGNLTERCYLSINREMKSVICGLFKCNITPEVKDLLVDANRQLSLIDSQGGLK